VAQTQSHHIAAKRWGRNTGDYVRRKSNGNNKRNIILYIRKFFSATRNTIEQISTGVTHLSIVGGDNE
jgi:hypothetical protein